MYIDFSLRTLIKLYKTILKENYKIIPLFSYIQEKINNRSVILRHDVDKKIENSLKVALIEHELGIKSSFYFRYSKAVFNKIKIEEISRLDHEVGYHYEVLSKTKGNLSKGIELFKYELNEFRKIADIKTICMHGSPLSKWDNRRLWDNYDYHDFGIIGEPYFDIDFDKVAYFTDTGRRWNGENINIRDKVISNKNYNIKTTDELICAFKENRLPDQVMLNIHPQRWNDRFIPWFWELVGQNVKNVVKKYFYVKKIEWRSKN